MTEKEGEIFHEQRIDIDAEGPGGKERDHDDGGDESRQANNQADGGDQYQWGQFGSGLAYQIIPA